MFEEGGVYSLGEFFWAHWVLETREFEVKLLPPLKFIEQIPWEKLNPASATYWANKFKRVFFEMAERKISDAQVLSGPSHVMSSPLMGNVRESDLKLLRSCADESANRPSDQLREGV